MIDLAPTIATARPAWPLVAAQPLGAIRQWLIGADVALFVAGELVLLLAVVYWVRRRMRGQSPALPNRPNRLTLETLALPVLAYSLAAVILTAALRWWRGSEPPVAWQLASNNVTQLAGLAICLAIARSMFDGRIRAFLLGSSQPHVVRLTALAMAFWIVSIPLCSGVLDWTRWLLMRLAPDYEFHEHTVIQTVAEGGQPVWFVAVLWLGTVAIAPLAEEAFFRGIMQTGIARLARRRGLNDVNVPRRWLGVVVAAVAFGLAHAAQWHAVPALTLFGILLGLAYERTGALLVPVLIHGLFNLKTMVYVTLG